MDGMYCDDLHLFIRRLMLGESVCGEGRGADGIRGMADALMKANPDVYKRQEGGTPAASAWTTWALPISSPSEVI